MDRCDVGGVADLSRLNRGMVVDVDLDPTKGSETGKIRPCVIVTNNTYNTRAPVIQVVPLAVWSERKARIVTNVEITPSSRNGLTRRSVADCLQTRPVDHGARLVGVRGDLGDEDIARIDDALCIVFDLGPDGR